MSSEQEEGTDFSSSNRSSCSNKTLPSPCSLHNEYFAKYICVDSGCREKQKIVCAECQLEGSHKKHEFVNESQFHARVKTISENCMEYLDAKLDPKRISDSISDNFEVLRIQVNEILNQIELGFLNEIHRILAPASSSNNRLSTLKESLRAQSQNSSTPASASSLLFQVKLFIEKEKLFDPEIEAAQKIQQKFNHTRVDILTYLASLANPANLTTSLNTQTNNDNENGTNAPPQIRKNTFTDCKTVSKVIRIEDICTNDQTESQKEQHNKELTHFNNNNHNNDEEHTQINRETQAVPQIISGIKSISQLSQSSTLAIVASDFKVHFVNSNNLRTQESKPLIGHNYSITSLLHFSSLEYDQASGNRRPAENNEAAQKHEDEKEEQTSLQHKKFPSYVVTSSADTSIKVWEEHSGALVSNIRSHSHEVSVLLKLSENCFVSGSKDYSICLHEFESMMHPIQVRSSAPIRLLEYPVKALARIGDGKLFFVVGFSNGSILLVDRVKTSMLFMFEGAHELGLYCMVSLNDPMFVSAGGDGKLKLWTTTSKNQCLAESVIIRLQEGGDYIKRIVVVHVHSILLLATRATIHILSYAAALESRTVNNRLRLANVAKIAISPNLGDILDILVLNADHPNATSEDQILVATQSSILYIS